MKTDRMRRITAEEAEEIRAEAAKKLTVGDRIEIRCYAEPFFIVIDDDGTDPADLAPPKYMWEPVKVIAILPPAPSGTVMVEVLHPDGKKTAESLGARTWRPRAS